MNIVNNEVLYVFQDSKSFLVEAYSEYGREFFAWENKDGSVTSLENIPGSYPPVTVVNSTDLREFYDKITWYSWIEDGIKDERLRKIAEEDDEILADEN